MMMTSRKPPRKGAELAWLTSVSAALVLLTQACLAVQAVCDMLKHFVR